MIKSIRALAIAVAVGLVLGNAQGAGSGTKKEDEKPGVAAYNAGVGFMKQGKWAEAQARFLAALEANEKMAEAHNNLAYSLRKQGQEHWTTALEHYDRAIELDPKLAEAYMYRGVLHALMGNEQAALADHRALVELDRTLADSLQAAIASGEEPDGLEGLARSW